MAVGLEIAAPYLAIIGTVPMGAKLGRSVDPARTSLPRDAGEGRRWRGLLTGRTWRLGSEARKLPDSQGTELSAG
jgi:hypothetical protein